MRINSVFCALAVLIAPAIGPIHAAYAQSPEQIDQLEPDGGEWQAEYSGQFGSTDDNERQHSLELFYGVSDSFAIGVEVEAEAEDGDLGFGEAGISALYKFNDPEEAPLGLGVMLSARLDGDGVLSEAEARFIAEKKTDKWWGQANVMLRHANEDGEKGELLAYGWNLSHAVTEQFWLGVEGSGQAAKLGGFDLGFEKAHFAGPAAVLDLEIANDKEVELGFAWFRRLSDEGPRNTARIFVQFDF
jgi:opacity protein-like surface antigen